MSEATIDSTVQETIDRLQQGSVEMLEVLSNTTVTQEILIKRYSQYVKEALRDTDVQKMFDSLARIAGLVGQGSPKEAQEIHAIIEDRGILMEARNPAVSPEVHMGVVRLLGKFATTTAALLPDYINGIENAFLENPSRSYRGVTRM